MSQQIFFNLAVADLPKSKTFFEALGYSFNPQFSNDEGACLVINDGHIYVMLLTHDHFKQFINKDLVDAKTANEAWIALSFENREEVDSMYDKAVAAGGKLYREEDLGFMYIKAIEDFDGHVWEFFHMDMNQIPTT